MPPRVAGTTSLLEAPPRHPEATATVLPAFDVAMEADACRIAHARLISGAWLKRLCGMVDERADLVLVVVSELCTNAVLHGRADAFQLRGWTRSDGRIRLEVQDWSPSVAPRPQNVDLMEVGGRGLFLVEAFVKEELGGTWGFAGDGAIAWCEVPLNSSTGGHTLLQEPSR
ncbi:ATP-binding protein [Streptomyces olivochromogenes]|uniref:ATP-binding protein n=1 Tax=Streptomyces olivochromogenes TaxID=1963 RepID=UPI0036D8C63A